MRGTNVCEPWLVTGEGLQFAEVTGSTLLLSSTVRQS